MSIGVSTVSRGGDRRPIRTRNVVGGEAARGVSVESAEIARKERVESVDDDLRRGLAGLIVLGVVIAVFALGYFVWVFYQLVVLGAT
jgi:hypothetical protein